jgi:hypothetical protein
MSTAFLPVRRRRALVLGSVTFLLHWTVLGWLNGQLGHVPLPRMAEPDAADVRLLPDEPHRLALPAPRPLPVHALPLPPPPLPPAPASVAEAPFETGPDVPASAAAGNMPPRDAPASAGQGGAAPAGPGLEAVVQAAPVASPAAAAPAPPPGRSYHVDLPPSADLLLAVERVDADGTHWSGEATLGWRLQPNAYRIKVDVGIRLLFAHVNLLELTSEGGTGDAGFTPALTTEKRRGRALTATHFNRQDGTITFSASQDKYPLAAGAQDKASVPLQLAAIARADPGQLAGPVDIQVGEDRDATVYSFNLVGQEDIDTGLGKLRAWHLSRPPKPGSYSSRLDVWLAPGRGWYPVRIRNTEASGAVTTQTVNNISITGTGS